MASRERFKNASRALLSDVFKSGNIDEALAFSLDIILEALEGEGGAFWMLNAKKDRLFPVSSKCPADVSNISMRIGTGVTGTVVSTQNPALIPDNSSAFPPPAPVENLGMTIYSLICVPLINNKEVIGCLERLRPDIIVERLTGDGPLHLLLAPEWIPKKGRVLNLIHHEMKIRDTFQGRYYEET